MTDILNIDQNLNLKHPQHFGGEIYFRLQVEFTLVVRQVELFSMGIEMNIFSFLKI